MPEYEVKCFPREETLGRNCTFWNINQAGCQYPKAEMQGRTSCEGIIDDVCLFLKDKRPPSSLTESQRRELRTRVPTFESNRRDIPPGWVR